MTPKQNFLETVHWGNPEYLCTDLNGLNLMLDPLTGAYDENMRDEWGCQWGYGGNKELNPFPCVLPGHDIITDIEDWKNQVKVPSVENIDYSGVKAIADQTDRETTLVGMSCSCGMFERTHALMPFEEALMAMLTDPEDYEELLDCVLEFKMAYAKKLYEATEFDLFYYHDDWGSKHSLFFSPETWDHFFRPREKKLIEYIKGFSTEKEILFMHHSDTFLEPLIPGMIDIGIDIWQGAIPQNDLVKLQKEYRGKIAFQGGIDIAAIDFPQPDEAKIRQEVRRAIDTYAPGGGFIVGIPSIAAMFPQVEEIYLDELGSYSAKYSREHMPIGREG
ncbi:MAG: methyltransferase [Lachnospiraceae bacterium]|nr:methyltransferase [Lachnospiraceae bacterium]